MVPAVVKWNALRQCVPVLVTLASLVTPTVLHAQDKPRGVAEFNEFNAKPLEGWKWDEDDRLNDLIAQLQEKELALQEVDARTAKLLGRKAGTKMDENMAWRAVDRMDLNGGGPIRWDAFYGRNAEKFFYHPVDPNTTYHTTTALEQVQPTQAGGVPGNQGVPAHQRPPQFDYMYRGYEKRQEKAKADAKEIQYKVDILKERRKQLEREVVLLWVKIAFRVLDREKVAEKPILRWAAVPQNAGEKEDTDRATVLTEATQLLAAALLFNEKRVESEPDKVFSTVSDAIEKNRKKFEDSLLRTTTLQGEAADKKKPLGQYKLLARRLEDISKSLSEGYVGWKDGDESDDEPTKFTGLRRVQDSVVNYSQILLALNELVDVMNKEWGLQINTEGTEFTPTWDVVYAAKTPVIPHAANEEPADVKKILQSLQGEWLAVAEEENNAVFPKGEVDKHNRRLMIKGQSLTMERRKSKLNTWTGRFQIDPQTGAFDWSGKNDENQPVYWTGIYSLEGKVLRLCFCFTADASARPTKFSTSGWVPGTPMAFYTFKKR